MLQYVFHQNVKKIKEAIIIREYFNLISEKSYFAAIFKLFIIKKISKNYCI